MGYDCNGFYTLIKEFVCLFLLSAGEVEKNPGNKKIQKS